MSDRTRQAETAPLTARTIGGLDQIDAAAWDACAGTENPFVGHTFLKALEDSGSCTEETGWLPQHLLLETTGGELVGAMPLYLKSHSYGEYVFDHSWAHAFEQAGGRYYPKLQAAVPFTPATGPRLLAGSGPHNADHRAALARAAMQIAERLGVSSLHVTFPTESDWAVMGAQGYLQRTGEQFHWYNDDYRTFDDFLNALNARKRKTIRRERRKAAETGIAIETLTGDALKPAHWDAFFRFYIDTGSRKWGTPYLTRAFFDIVHETMADRVALIMCSRDGRYIAGALNFIGETTLFGRHWGCVEHHDCLHFEACYYRAIDFAIERGLAVVEAGAQGPHKVQRGYRPTMTYSAHWIAHEGFRDAVADFLKREQREVAWEIEAIEAHHSPFRKDGPTE